ncbi:hypothetical protein GX48_07194 [Paracoccidioides brasiliensis]|nr:hypothetical protein GX48_07194 [Paracoccidioides brasiliensis]
MHIRPLLAADLPDAASVVADAMLDDEVWQYLSPRRMEYYDNYRASFVRRLKIRLLTPGYVTYVAVADPPNDIEGFTGQVQERGDKVVGYAAWVREGTSPAARKWRRNNETIGCWLERSLQNIEKKYIDTFNPDKSLDKVKLETYISATQDNFPSELFPELWYLATLAVHPDYQRRGIGKMLTSWGIEQARAENVPVGLEPSDKGLGLYEKLGFQEVRRSEWIAGKSAVVMIWEPPGLSPEESWVERGRRHEEKKKNKEKIDDVS